MNRELILNKFSILVCSFDSVSDILQLWDKKFFKSPFLFKKNFKIFYGLNFYNENNKFLFHNKNILYSKTFNWSFSLKSWLNQISSEYILLILDDQVIKTFSTSKVKKIINDIDKSGIIYAPISYGTHLTRKIINKEIILKTKVPTSKYSINLQPSIWRKSFLINLLNESINPWEFEIKSSQRYNKENFNAFFYITKDISFFEQYIERGKIYPKRFHEIFKKPYQLILKREKVNIRRRFISHIGYIYKIIKEFINSLKSFILFKLIFI
tara:strand:- start:32 stop:835 length:804 start_codon:yes stop_codon:yes gene_type:complete